MKAIAQKFREFEAALTTPTWESEAAKGHRASIESCLDSEFGLDGFFQSGSFGNGTNIPVSSDVDRFAVFSPGVLPKSSIHALRKILFVLKKRFPRTGIKIRRPAIVVDFGTEGGEKTEIIPACFLRMEGESEAYEIPHPARPTDWVFSSPRLLKRYVNEANDKADGRLKPLIRFLKVWKGQKKVPIQSIYLELACAAFLRTEGFTTPDIDIARFLNFLSAEQLPEIGLPSGIGAPISASPKPGQAEEALRKVKFGASAATAAATSGIERKFLAACRRWKWFFGPLFPNPRG